MAEEEEEVLATDAALATLRVLFVEAFGEAYRQEGKYAVAFEAERGLIELYGVDYEAPQASELALLSDSRRSGHWRGAEERRRTNDLARNGAPQAAEPREVVCSYGARPYNPPVCVTWSQGLLFLKSALHFARGRLFVRRDTAQAPLFVFVTLRELLLRPKIDNF